MQFRLINRKTCFKVKLRNILTMALPCPIHSQFLPELHFYTFGRTKLVKAKKERTLRILKLIYVCACVAQRSQEYNSSRYSHISHRLYHGNLKRCVIISSSLRTFFKDETCFCKEIHNRNQGKQKDCFLQKNMLQSMSRN